MSKIDVYCDRKACGYNEKGKCEAPFLEIKGGKCRRETKEGEEE